MIFISIKKNNSTWLCFCPIYACVHAQLHNCVQPSVTVWTIAHQTSVSMGFPRQEYWSGLPFPSLSDLPDPRMEHSSPESPLLAHKFFTSMPRGKPPTKIFLKRSSRQK